MANGTVITFILFHIVQYFTNKGDEERSTGPTGPQGQWDRVYLRLRATGPKGPWMAVYLLGPIKIQHHGPKAHGLGPRPKALWQDRPVRAKGNRPIGP